MRKPLSPITLTDAAADRVKALLARHAAPPRACASA